MNLSVSWEVGSWGEWELGWDGVLELELLN